MTAIVGILCKNGVVIGADSSTTFVHGHQFRTIEQPTEKISLIGDHVIVAGTGSVGLDQRFCAIVKAAWDQKLFQRDPIAVGKKLSQDFLRDLQDTFLKPGQYGALVAFPFGHRFHLCEFTLSDFQPELKTEKIWYCSMGSAQMIMDPFLALMREVYWEDSPPDIQDGVFAATWTIEHAIKVNPGGVNKPIRIAVLELGKKGKTHARMLEDSELDEHRQNIKEAKEQLRKLRRQHQELSPDIPDVPKPEKLK